MTIGVTPLHPTLGAGVHGFEVTPSGRAVAPEVFAEIEAAFNRRGILVALRRVIRRPNAALEMLSRDFVGVMTNTAPTPLIAVPGIRRSSLWKTTMPSASIHLFDSNDANKPVHSAVATSASWW